MTDPSPFVSELNLVDRVHRFKRQPGQTYQRERRSTMPYCRVVMLTVSLAAVLFVHTEAAGPTFVPDAVLRGSSLTGWHVLGSADWRAQDGEVIGAAKSAAG